MSLIGPSRQAPFSGRPSLTEHCGHGWACRLPAQSLMTPQRSSTVPARTIEYQGRPGKLTTFGLPEVAMKCLRIYATPDGESHFGDADVPTTTIPLFPNEAPFQLSGHYPASRIRFVHVPAGVREAGWHIPPGRVLAVWLDGIVEFETSDGEVRRVSAGSSVLVEDTHGKGHISRHPVEGQSLILVTLPHGLDSPECS